MFHLPKGHLERYSLRVIFNQPKGHLERYSLRVIFNQPKGHLERYSLRVIGRLKYHPKYLSNISK